MNGLIVMPVEAVNRIDQIVTDFRAAHSDATDDDAANVRQELVNAFAAYGRIPEFEIVRKDTE